MKRLQHVIPSIVMAGLFCVCGVVQAIPLTIDFDGDAVGARANGFQSVDAAGVSFFDTVGADLIVLPNGTGNALGVGLDQDGSALEIRFAFALDFLSLVFGNDDPANTNPGDLAALTLFFGVTQVGQVTLQLNRDDLANQTLAFGSLGGLTIFDRALFAFTDPSLSLFTGGGATNVGASELLDSLSLNSVEPAVRVSEPEVVGLLMMGMIVLAAVRRRYSKAMEARVE